MQKGARSVTKKTKKQWVNESSMETPRTLLEKVVKEKNQRRSSTYVLSDKESSGSMNKTKLSLKNHGSDKRSGSTIYSDIGGSATPDLLLLPHTAKTHIKEKSTHQFQGKHTFNFSKYPTNAANVLNNEGTNSSVNKKIVSLNTKNNVSSGKPVKKIDDYFSILNTSKTNDLVTNSRCMSNKQSRDKTKPLTNSNQQLSSFSLHDKSKNKTPTVFIEAIFVKDKMHSTSKKVNSNLTKMEIASSKSVSNENVKRKIDYHNSSADMSVSSNKSSPQLKQQQNLSSKLIDNNRNKRSKISPPSSSNELLDTLIIERKTDKMEGKVKKKIKSKCKTKNSDIIDIMLEPPVLKINENKERLQNHTTDVNNSPPSLLPERVPTTESSLRECTSLKNSCNSSVSNEQNNNRNNNSSGFDKNNLTALISAIDNSLSSEIPRVSDDITRNILQHFSEMPIPNNTLSVVNVCCDDFWEQILETLYVYAKHAGRDSITVEDIELLLYRQGYVKDRNSINALISKYLPLEMSLEILPIATAGNVL